MPHKIDYLYVYPMTPSQYSVDCPLYRAGAGRESGKGPFLGKDESWMRSLAIYNIYYPWLHLTIQAHAGTPGTVRIAYASVLNIHFHWLI